MSRLPRNALNFNPITVAAVKRGEPVARKELDHGLYMSRWQRASPLGRDYVAEMASLGETCTSAQVAQLMNRSVSDLSSIRLSQIELGQIY